MSDLCFNEESDYSEENTSDNEDYRSAIFQPFQFEPKQKKKTCGNESHKKEIKHIHASAADLLYIRIGNLDWYKYGHFKNETREIDRLFSLSIIDAMLTASAKILEREGSTSPSSFHGQLPDYQSYTLVLSI